MVIVAAMAGHDPQAKTIFDGLWEFRAAHPSSKDPRLMDWNVPQATGNDSAFDGDMDIAYGLLMAHAQWGSDGDVNYLAEAQERHRRHPRLDDRSAEQAADARRLGEPQRREPQPVDDALVRLHARPLPRVRPRRPTTPRTGPSVTIAVQDVITNIQANESAATGLLPDFIRLVGAAHDPQPAEAGFLEGDHDGHYWYNAGRDPWRLGVDAILNNDPTTLAQVQKLSTWARTSTGGNREQLPRRLPSRRHAAQHVD